MKNILLLVVSLLVFTHCNKGSEAAMESRSFDLDKPNIVLIMSDDQGYETLSVNGSTEYKTPRLDAIAAAGVRYTNMYSTPICSPSRSEIMTGKKAIWEVDGGNFQAFGWLKEGERTFANACKECGFETGIVGKWQLSGSSGEFQSIDTERANRFGFDEYRLYNYLNSTGDGIGFNRYTAPTYFETGGSIVSHGSDVYGPDLNIEWAKKFVSKHKSEPFLLYWTMTLPHSPYIMTPNNPEWTTATEDQKFSHNGNTYYGEMIEYGDMLVGDLFDHLAAEGILEKTIFIFLSDNGTQRTLTNETTTGSVIGAKGNTLDAGIHVPLIVHYPEGGKGGTVVKDFITLDDFFPTINEAIGLNETGDGRSFYDTFAKGTPFSQTEIVEYYDPLLTPSSSVYPFRDKYAMDYNYKLYQNGTFYNYITDPTEINDLSGSETSEEYLIRANLKILLNTLPNVD